MYIMENFVNIEIYRREFVYKITIRFGLAKLFPNLDKGKVKRKVRRGKQFKICLFPFLDTI